MAQEEIKLVGSFKDDITPKLKKLNKEIATIGRSFEKFSRHLRPISREFGRMAASAERFNVAMKSQRSALAANARAMGEYKKQAGKMSGAMRAMEAQRAKAMRAQGVSRSQQKRGGAGGAVPIPITPSAGKSTGKSFGTNAGASFKQSIGATAIGTTIGMMASQAIMSGVQGLKNLALAPFKKFGAMFSERIGDEMDDIKSAGGLFALDMDLTQASGNEKFFKNYNEALRFQEKLNIDMAESAASLPGVTSQYVATSRQLTDTIQMVMEKDREGFSKMAAGFGANVAGGGVDASKEAMRTVLQKMTEQVMLQSQGQQGGLPMHIAIQQLMGKEQGKIKMQAFTNKFRAAFQKNPLLKNFLLRAEEDMNKTAAGSHERLKVIMDTFDRAMPKEVINKMRGSISGMQEALRSGLLDPQAGLFGMSRANILNGQKLMKKNVDDFGNVLYKISEDISIDENFAKQLQAVGIDKAMGDTLKGAELTVEQLTKLGYSLDKTGKILDKDGKTAIGDISKSSTYIFEQIREILAGYGPVLLEFVGVLPQLFDPFAQMTESLMSFRDKAQSFILGFNNNLTKIEERAQSYAASSDVDIQGMGAKLKGQSRARAAFSTIANTLASIGGIDKSLQQKVLAVTQSVDKAGIEGFDDAIKPLLGKLLKGFLESDMMKEFAKIGGLIIGGITKGIVDVIKMITGAAKGKMGNKITEGFVEGIKESFGGMDFNEVKGIIGDAALSIISKGLDIVFTQIIPNLFQMYVGGLFKGLFSGNIVTMILSGIGIAKLAAMIAGPLSMMGSALVYLSPLLISIGGIIMTVITTTVGAFASLVVMISGAVMTALGTAATFITGTVVPAIAGVATALLPIIAVVAAIAGAVMIVVAIFRHLDLITSSVVEGFKILYNSFVWMDATIKSAILNFAASLMEGLANIPVIGGAFKGGAEGTRAQANAQSARADEAAQNIGSSITQIGANTAESFRRTAEDVNMLAEKFGVAGEASDAVKNAFEDAAKTTESASKDVSTALVGAATESGSAITGAANGLANALNSAASSIKNVASASGGTTTTAEAKYDGKGGKMMPLAAAIQKERQMMPSGANLVIANSSETVIPAFNGHKGDGFKGFSFAELESAAGFDRMASYTDQISELADKTANSFSMGVGMLGGGSATLNAMEALGHSFGLTTTSGHRPGDPGFHGVNRARDLSNGGGETPEMNAAAAKMASEFGSSLTELIYTPMGFSIKNGQKTGLISPDNHYHHIHVAVAEGLSKAAVFNSQMAAEQYERRMMPAGAEPMKVNLASMTANSSEFGGGRGVTMGDINVSVSGVDDPKAIANQVAEEILAAIEKSTYSEVFTS